VCEAVSVEKGARRPPLPTAVVCPPGRRRRRRLAITAGPFLPEAELRREWGYWLKGRFLIGLNIQRFNSQHRTENLGLRAYASNRRVEGWVYGMGGWVGCKN
jgi:hypothetical protein